MALDFAQQSFVCSKCVCFRILYCYSFERTYDKLMSIERTIEAVGAKKILDCLRADQGNELLKYNYYSNKFDSTGKYCS